MKQHRLDAFSLLFGLLFVGAGLLLLTGVPALGRSLPMEWVGPLVAIGLGLILFLAARPEPKKPPEDQAESDPGPEPESA